MSYRKRSLSKMFNDAGSCPGGRTNTTITKGTVSRKKIMALLSKLEKKNNNKKKDIIC